MRQFKVTERYTPRTTKAADNYLSEVDRTKPMSPELEFEVATAAAQGDRKAKERLILANLRFVLTVAKMYTRDTNMYQDLVSAGNIGLVEAADSFDPSRGFKFISYAVWHIRKEMINHLSSKSRLIRLPVNKNAFLKHVRDAADKISMQLGRDATTQEILEYLKEAEGIEGTKILEQAKTLNASELEKIIEIDKKQASLDFKYGEGNQDDATLLDVLHDDSIESPDFRLEKEDFKPVMDLLLGKLNPIERDIVLRIHGLSNESRIPENPKTIAEEYECTREAIRVRYNKAIRKLRKYGKAFPKENLPV